jgi:hypothetical protein
MCLTIGMERFSVQRTSDGYVVIDLASAACTSDDLAQDAAESLAAELNAKVSAGQVMPHIYFAWAEGNPFYFLFRYLISGEGDVPPVTREVLRRAEPDRSNRPWVHVG